jgi:O-antigen ligase
LSYLGFDARLVYGQAAFNTYLAYPVLGVGLGNYAFYFEEMLPYRPIAEVPEVLHMVTPEPGRDRLITSKNLYLRLLAETGIVGATAYLAFVIAHVGCAIYLWLSIDRRWQYWGTASLCGLLAFALSAMTFDSFVIPNTWVVFGLICAATRVMMQPLSSHGETE